MPNRDVLALGTSAGGVEALMRLVGGLPGDLPAAVLVTIHMSRHHVSALDQILSGAGPLPARFARDGEPLRNQQIFIAPPDRHLLVAEDALRLGSGPRENNARPSIDAMLRSAAQCCGGRAVGVVLTGTLGDGASGLWALRQCGGLTVVQDPHDAAFSEMPQRALEKVHPDHVVSLDEMPRLLNDLVRDAAGVSHEPSPSIPYEAEMALRGGLAMEEMDRIARRSVLACPDCHGVMWEIDEGELVRYRCHVGHTYIAELMSIALDENLRRAMDSAQRALEERVALAKKLERQAVEHGHRLTAKDWASRVEDYEAEARTVREAIARLEVAAAEVAAREPSEVEASELAETSGPSG